MKFCNYFGWGCLLILLPGLLLGQNTGQEQKNYGEIHGNFQTDFQYYFRDSIIDPTGEFFPDERFLAAGFTNLIYTNGDFQAGVRYENYQNNLLGLPEGFRGEGIAYRFARFNKDGLDVTVGNFYEQFGSGMIFRSFEERGLGLDNALDGVRLRYSPVPGLYLKTVVGRQRLYFAKSQGIVRGADAELNLNEAFKGLEQSPWFLTLGGSFVGKYQRDTDPALNLPENVGAYGGRFLLQRGGFAWNTEYSYKINDPSADNGYIYRSGEGFLSTLTYSQHGFGLLLAYKMLDDMSFRSERGATLTDAQINFLPPTTKLHTYTLPALYPYAVQPTGEVSRQAELTYTFKRGSSFGGRYGTTISVNFSDAYSIDKTLTDKRNITSTQDPSIIIDSTLSGTRGYERGSYFRPGDIKYFQDFNVEIRKTFSRKWKGVFTYYNFEYNQEVLEKGITDREILTRDDPQEIFYIQAAVVELLYKFKPRHSLRMEFQGMFTKQDRGDWLLALFEYSISPKWFFAIQDSWNYGNPDPSQRIHYVLGSIGFTLKTTRFQMNYGRQMQGIFCVGGICRVVPPSNGITMTVTSNF